MMGLDTPETCRGWNILRISCASSEIIFAQLRYQFISGSKIKQYFPRQCDTCPLLEEHVRCCIHNKVQLARNPRYLNPFFRIFKSDINMAATYSSALDHHHHHHHHHHISVMELGHMLTRSGLTYPEVSSNVCHDSFCQLGNSVSLSWVIFYEEYVSLGR
jgi:hypothetical protein